MSSADLANGGHPGSTAPPTVTLPSSEDSWSHQPDGSKERSQPHDQSWKEPNPNDWGPGGDRDQTWLSGRNRTLSGQEQTRMTGRGRGPEQSWGAARDRGHDQASQEPGRNQGREDQGSSVQEQAWESGGNQEPVWSQDMWRPGTYSKKDHKFGLMLNLHRFDHIHFSRNSLIFVEGNIPKESRRIMIFFQKRSKTSQLLPPYNHQRAVALVSQHLYSFF